MEGKIELERLHDERDDRRKAAIVAGRKKKRHGKRLLLLLLLLLFTGGMLGTSTYAWFTSNKTVTINDITVNVSAANGIQISVDGKNWKSVISTTDILGASTVYASAVNQLPSTMEPVSTSAVADTSTGHLPMYYGVIENRTKCTDNSEPTGTTCTTGSYDSTRDNTDYILTATAETDTAGTEGKYVVFDMFLQLSTDKTSEPVYINTGAASGVFFESTDTGIKQAARIAFVNMGSTTSTDSITNIQALNTGHTVQLWEPNAGSHTSTGVNNAEVTYGITTSTGTENSPLAYDGVKAVITKTNDLDLGAKSDSTPGSTYLAAVTPTWTTNEGATDQIAFNEAFPKGITKYRVYMWIEGQDVDCENNASGGTIDFRLQFTTIEQEGD